MSRRRPRSSAAPLLLILITGMVVILCIALAPLASARTKPTVASAPVAKKLIYKEMGIEIKKFCDKTNLVYIMVPQYEFGAKWDGANPTIFVLPDDQQCGSKR